MSWFTFKKREKQNQIREMLDALRSSTDAGRVQRCDDDEDDEIVIQSSELSEKERWEYQHQLRMRDEHIVYLEQKLRAFRERGDDPPPGNFPPAQGMRIGIDNIQQVDFSDCDMTDVVVLPKRDRFRKAA